MTSKQPIDPATALRNLFEIISEEASVNPKFARRLLDATGHVVQFRADESIAAIDPILVAAQGHDEFRKTFISMSVADVKKIGKSSGLVTSSVELRFPKGQLVDLLWNRATERRNDLFPHRREAAE